jgi:hypothetical protein
MMVMPADSTGYIFGYLAGKYENRIGQLITATAWKKPVGIVKWAMDNGKYPCWKNGTKWNEAEFIKHANKKHNHKPMWIVVPDCVADRDGTMREWEKWANQLLSIGHTLAMAVQDGMTPDDVPTEASVIFVGGTTKWKWRNLKMWTSSFSRCHVGRVGSYRMLCMAHEAGAESCDSSGWGREGYGSRRISGLIRYLEESTHGKRQQEFL